MELVVLITVSTLLKRSISSIFLLGTSFIYLTSACNVGLSGLVEEMENGELLLASLCDRRDSV